MPSLFQPTDTPRDPATLAIGLGRPHRPGDPLNVPIEPASSYLAGGERAYSRDGNRSWEPVEQVLAGLESPTAAAFGLAFASGVGVLTAVVDVVTARRAQPAPLVVAPSHPYSGTTALLHRFADAGRITLRTVAVDDAEAVRRASDGAALLWLESPTNPAMEICDLAAAALAGHDAGALVACDNTFATPLVQRPLELGCDLVVHSASKYIGGHSDLVLGVAVTRDGDLAGELHTARTLLGLIPGTLEAWLAARGVRTMPLRMRAAAANAAAIATRLQRHPLVAWVRYPGLPQDPDHAVAMRQMSSGGAIVTFALSGDTDGAIAERIADGTRVWLHATSLGGVESTLERRRRHSFESTEVPAGLIRLSVGCEDVDDLWDDLAQAIERA